MSVYKYPEILISMVLLTVSDSVLCKENIIFILADDYGYNDIGYHGSEIQTPNLDKLAAEGVKLENYYVQPICTPTRSQFLSGRYQIHTGLQHGIIWPDQRNSLPIEIPTMADQMKGLGYSTHMVGKWHVGFYKKELTPIHRGFDTYFGYLTGSEDYNTHRRCWNYKRSEELHAQDQQFPGQEEVLLGGEGSVCGMDLHDGDTVSWNHTGEYSTELFARKAQEIIRDHVKNSPDKPLFMYLPFQAVHAPLEVPQRYMDKYKHIESKHRRIYAGMVSALDEAVGNITATLKEAGLWDTTTLAFSTDNGGQVFEGGNNAPLRGWKGSLWEGGMKGNGFIRSNLIDNPRGIRRGLMHVTDWFPTLVNLAGGNTTSLKLDGHDQWSLINGDDEHGSRKELLHNIDPLYAQRGKDRYPGVWDVRTRAALRSGNWKIITGNPGNSSWVPAPKNGVEYPHFVSIPEPRDKNLWLFDVGKDPLETQDVSEMYPGVVKELLGKLAAYNSTAVPCRFPAQDPLSSPKLNGGAWQPWVM